MTAVVESFGRVESPIDDKHTQTSSYIAVPWDDAATIARVQLLAPSGGGFLRAELPSLHYCSQASSGREAGPEEIDRIAPALIERHRQSLSELANS